MTPERILAEPPRVLPQQARIDYFEKGFALVEGAGHSVYFEKPDVFNHLLLDFLRRHVLETNG